MSPPLTMLAEFVDRDFLPTRLSVQKKTREYYQRTAREYDAFRASQGLNGDSSPFDRRAMTEFLAALYRDDPTRAGRTNTRRRALITLWRFAAQLGLAGPLPPLPKAKEAQKTPQAWTIVEVLRIIAQCRRLTGTVKGIPANLWWESFILAIYSTGVRVNALLSCGPLDLEVGTGALHLRWQTQKNWKEQTVFLSAEAIKAIVQHLDVTRDRIWPAPKKLQKFNAKFRRILKAARVKAGEGYGPLFHQLRRTNISLIAKYYGTDAAREAAGHVSAATTRKSYIDPRVAAPEHRPRLLPDIGPMLTDRQPTKKRRRGFEKGAGI